MLNGVVGDLLVDVDTPEYSGIIIDDRSAFWLFPKRIAPRFAYSYNEINIGKVKLINILYGVEL